MGVKCDMCRVDIRAIDLVVCKCGRNYHKTICAVQADGLEDGVIDACCGIRRVMRGKGMSQQITDGGSNSDSEEFLSPSINNNNKNRIDLDKKSFDLRDVKGVMLEVLDESEKLANVEEAIEGLTRLTSSFRGEVMGHRNELAQIQSDMNELDLKLKAVVNGNVKVDVGELVVQECMVELTERQKRKKNLIIHGMAEGHGDSSKQKVVPLNCVGGKLSIKGNLDVNLICKEDHIFIVNLMEKVLNESEANGVQCKGFNYLRLGIKPQAHLKVRPIKLEFFDESVAKFVFQNMRKLLLTQEFIQSARPLVVALDRTDQQRKKYSHVKEQLQERKRRGEKDLVLRERDGIYAVVKLSRVKLNQREGR